MDRSPFYTMSDRTKLPVLFNAVPEYENYLGKVRPVHKSEMSITMYIAYNLMLTRVIICVYVYNNNIYLRDLNPASAKKYEKLYSPHPTRPMNCTLYQHGS